MQTQPALQLSRLKHGCDGLYAVQCPEDLVNSQVRRIPRRALQFARLSLCSIMQGGSLAQMVLPKGHKHDAKSPQDDSSAAYDTARRELVFSARGQVKLPVSHCIMYEAKSFVLAEEQPSMANTSLEEGRQRHKHDTKAPQDDSSAAYDTARRELVFSARGQVRLPVSQCIMHEISCAI